MDKLEKFLTVPPSKAPDDGELSSAVNSNDTNIEIRPTAFKRNHGVIMRGVKLMYDPTLYLAFDLKREKRLEDPAFIAWLTGGETYKKIVTDSDSVIQSTTNAVRCKACLIGAEWEHDCMENTPDMKTEHEAKEISTLDTTAMGSNLLHDKPRNTIPRNRIGQRVDPPVDFDKELRAKMQKERWCSNYHLKGSCPINECRFRHGTLDNAGKNALLSLTRGNYCRNGNGCKEPDCYAGHQCPYEPCNKEKDCHFPPEMHVADKQIVNMELPFSPKTSRRPSDEEKRQREGKG